MISINRDRSRSRSRTKIERTSFVVRGDDPAESIAIDNVNQTIETGMGDDKIEGDATAIAGFDATATGIKGGTINTDAGRDRIEGEATATAGYESSDPSSMLVATATGIDGVTIDMGEDRDILTGEATAFCGDPALPCSGATAIGIKDSDILLGGGNDLVRAIARGNGTNIGIQDSTINGEAGNDLFDLQNFSGTNDIIGGTGVDTLKLGEVSSIDYNFILGSATLLKGTIQNMTDPTEVINVSGVENFTFLNGSSDFNTLFAVTPLSIT